MDRNDGSMIATANQHTIHFCQVCRRKRTGMTRKRRIGNDPPVHKKTQMPGICVFLALRGPSPVFLPDDLIHLLRSFPASAGKPQLDDGIKAAPEKLDMVRHIAVAEIPGGKGGVIELDRMLFVITQLEVGFIEQLVFPDVAKQPQIIVAVHIPAPAVGVQAEHIPLQIGFDLIGKGIDVLIIGEMEPQTRLLMNVLTGTGVYLFILVLGLGMILGRRWGTDGEIKAGRSKQNNR